MSSSEENLNQLDFQSLLNENILSVLDDSIIITDLEGKIKYWNDGAEKIFGYTEKEVLGKTVAILYPEQREDVLNNDLDNILNGRDYIGEWKGIRKDGEELWLDIKISLLKNKVGKVLGFIGVSREITDKKKLLQHKLLLANIIEYSDDGIESMDLEGNILSWNKGAERIYGYTASEIIGKNALVLYSNESKDNLTKNLEIIKSGKSIRTFETKRKNKNGEIIYISISFSPLKDDYGSIYGVTVITRDLTEQKQTLKELLESEIKYQTIFENSGEGFLLLTDRFIECNKKLCEMWGYSKKEIIGKTPGDFSPKFQPDGSISSEKAKNYINEAYKTGFVNFYWQHLRKDGEIIETKITLSRIRDAGKDQIIAVVQDLSVLFRYQNKLKLKSKELLDQNKEIQLLNEELNETNARLKIINKQIESNERKFRVAFKTSPDSVNINRLSDGLYVDINEGFTILTGYTEDDVKGKTSKDIGIWVNMQDRERLLVGLKENEYVSNLEAAFRKKDGTIATALMSASLIDINGEKHILSITRDISERKMQEEQLREAMKKAEESDMLKSAFLANMSHEIRTPMNAILGFGQLLKEKKVDKDKQDKYLDIIITRSKNLLQIINDIIDISKIEANQLNIEIHEFSLYKLLYELFSQYEAELITQDKTKVKLDFKGELDKSASIIASDELRLKQILTNLISNAIKFTDSGEITFGYTIKGKKLEFFVRDTGVGINKELIGQIFERFRQADDSSTREFGGTGLGLSISKQLVEMLGGKIWVDSEINIGSTFYFTIPFNPIVPEIKATEQRKDISLDLTGKNILIVEDDSISMAYLEELMENTNANIIKAQDGIKAIHEFKTQKVDLILMDINLPRMTGNEATQEIRKLNKLVPIIAQSAFAMPNERKKSLSSGCNEYITKPIDSRILFSTIKKLLL